jgi:hypothetical protein
MKDTCKDQTWISPETSATSGCCHAIANLQKKKRKEAACGHGGVQTSLERTFVGPTEARRVATEWERAGKPSPCKAVNANDMHSLDNGRTPLTLLAALTPEPLPELLCEQGMVEENNKAGHARACQLSSNKSAHAPKPTGERPRATSDLFAGCGGLSCGFQQEGCEETCMVELDPIACATLATNFPDAKIYQERAEHFLETCESETMKSCPKLGDVGHINATQGQFSTSKFL